MSAPSGFRPMWRTCSSLMRATCSQRCERGRMGKHEATRHHRPDVRAKFLEQARPFLVVLDYDDSSGRQRELPSMFTDVLPSFGVVAGWRATSCATKNSTIFTVDVMRFFSFRNPWPSSG